MYFASVLLETLQNKKGMHACKTFARQIFNELSQRMPLRLVGEVPRPSTMKQHQYVMGVGLVSRPC